MISYLAYVIITVLIVNTKPTSSLTENVSSIRSIKTVKHDQITKKIIDYGVSETLKEKLRTNNHTNNPILQNEILKEFNNKLKKDLNSFLNADQDNIIINKTLKNYITDISQNDYLGWKNLKIENLKLLQDHYYNSKDSSPNKIINKNKYKMNDKKKPVTLADDNFFKQPKKTQFQDDVGKQESELMMELLDPEAEKEDEINDFEIFYSILKTIAYYQIQELTHLLYNTKRRVKRDEEVICYGSLGCFRDEGPFDYLDLLPSPPEEVNTQFILYTNASQEKDRILQLGNASSIINSGFSASRLTKVIIHGFGSSCHRIWVNEMKKVFFHFEDVNIICVDWENGALTPNYARAACNTQLVGRQVAIMIEEINALMNSTLDQFHLIGFSLGAHVSGYAGAQLKNLERITGLDPAGPLFESFPPAVRLDAEDAKFVDIIHTNADSILWGGLGAYEAMGDVDFYPNGGRDQNGCANLFVGGVSDILWPTQGDGRYLCNHRRGYKYFVQSVFPMCKFPSFVCQDYETFLEGDCFPCAECGNMGYYADKASGRGQMYLVTRETEPFCGNQYKVIIFHSRGSPTSSPVSNYGKIEVTFVSPSGINETLPLTRNEDTVMTAGGRTTGILVPHPEISSIPILQLKYTAYKGWLTSGSNKWAINKVSIMDSFGIVHSYCYQGTTLVSEQTMNFPLTDGDCNPMDNTLIWNNPIGNNEAELENEDNMEMNTHGSTEMPEAPNTLSSPNNSSKIPSIGSVSPTTVQSTTKESSTFSVIHYSSSIIPANISTKVNDTNISDINNIISNISYETPTQEINPQISTEFELTTKLLPPKHNFTDEEYASWIDAPPPNLETYSEDPITSTTRIDGQDFMISSEEPVNIIPAPNLSTSPKSIPTLAHIEHDNILLMQNEKVKFVVPTEVSEQQTYYKDLNIPSKVKIIINVKTIDPQLNMKTTRDPFKYSSNSYPNININGNINSQYYRGIQDHISKVPQTPSLDLQVPYPSHKNHQPGFYSPKVIKDRSPFVSLNTVNQPYLRPLRPPPQPIYRSPIYEKHAFSELTLESEKEFGQIPYNSLIDGEFPLQERARALSIFNTPINSVVRLNSKPKELLKPFISTHPSIKKIIPQLIPKSQKLETIIGHGLAPQPQMTPPNPPISIANEEFRLIHDKPYFSSHPRDLMTNPNLSPHLSKNNDKIKIFNQNNTFNAPVPFITPNSANVEIPHPHFTVVTSNNNNRNPHFMLKKINNIPKPIPDHRSNPQIISNVQNVPSIKKTPYTSYMSYGEGDQLSHHIINNPILRQTYQFRHIDDGNNRRDILPQNIGLHYKNNPNHQQHRTHQQLARNIAPVFQNQFPRFSRVSDVFRTNTQNNNNRKNIRLPEKIQPYAVDDQSMTTYDFIDSRLQRRPEQIYLNTQARNPRRTIIRQNHFNTLPQNININKNEQQSWHPFKSDQQIIPENKQINLNSQKCNVSNLDINMKTENLTVSEITNNSSDIINFRNPLNPLLTIRKEMHILDNNPIFVTSNHEITLKTNNPIFVLDNESDKKRELTSNPNINLQMEDIIYPITYKSIQNPQNDTRSERNPFYIQILPPNFSSLPRLETFSLPRRHFSPPIRSSPEITNIPPIKKRSRIGHARSMGEREPLPIPGGRAAIFLPLQLPLRGNHNTKYIPLRS